jgi:hypothetical protein
METVTKITEEKILGYFETIKANFFVSQLAEQMLFNEKGQFLMEIPDTLDLVFKSFYKEYIQFKKYLFHGDGAIRQCFRDQIMTDVIVGSWVCFELVIKDLANNDYSLIDDEFSINYNAKSLGLSKVEKRNIDLFYYIRNAFVHYNGAYYKSKEISHTYNSVKFNSKGNEGTKIKIPNMKFAYQIHLDIEEYTMKCWSNLMKIKNIDA